MRQGEATRVILDRGSQFAQKLWRLQRRVIQRVFRAQRHVGRTHWPSKRSKTLTTFHIAQCSTNSFPILLIWNESMRIQTRQNRQNTEDASNWSSPHGVESNDTIRPQEEWSATLFHQNQKLNNVTVRDSYPLPTMDKCINSLGTDPEF